MRIRNGLVQIPIFSLVFDFQRKSIENSRILFGPQALLERRLWIWNKLSTSMSSCQGYDGSFGVKNIYLKRNFFYDDVKHVHFSFTSTQPNSTFYFTHSGTMLKMLAHLGLYQDDFMLTHKDFDKNRKWRVGNIDAFASNLLFVSFE